MVYRFGTSLYFANASRLMEDVAALAGHGGPLRWMVLDCAAIGDVDFTASTVLAKVVEHVQQRQVRLVLSSVLGPVRQRLDRYGISKALGQDAYFDTPGEALEAFHSTARKPMAVTRPRYPHTRAAVDATSSSLRRSSSTVIRLPSEPEAKPHCGLMARFSSGT